MKIIFTGVSGFNLGRSIFPVNFRIKWLLWNVEIHFDCAGSHKVCVCILRSIWAAAFSTRVPKFRSQWNSKKPWSRKGLNHYLLSLVPKIRVNGASPQIQNMSSSRHLDFGQSWCDKAKMQNLRVKVQVHSDNLYLKIGFCKPNTWILMDVIWTRFTDIWKREATVCGHVWTFTPAGIQP